MLAMALPSIPMALNIHAVSAPPTKTDSIVFQLAMPVKSSSTAPMPMAMTLVSPMEPGMSPVIISMERAG